MHVVSDRELAERLGAQVAGEVHAVPDALLDRRRTLARQRPGDEQLALAVALLHRDEAVALLDERAEVGMGQAVAQHELGVEHERVLGALHAADDDVGAAPLRADEGLGVGLAAIEVGEHLVGRVAALGAVAVDLPLAAQGLRRIEVHLHVVGRAHLLGVVAEQPLDDGEALGREVDERAERAVVVLVDGLEDRLAHAQALQVLGHDVEVVALRVQRRDAALGALAAVVLVVVVGADVRDGVLAEQAHEPLAQRRLARRRVTHDSKHDRSCHAAVAPSRPDGHGPLLRGRVPARRHFAKSAAPASGGAYNRTLTFRPRPARPR